MSKSQHDDVPLITAFLTYLSYVLLIAVGHVRDALSTLLSLLPALTTRPHSHPSPSSTPHAPLLNDFQDFYTRHLYERIQDCWSRPIASKPGTWISALRREPSKLHPRRLLTSLDESHATRALNLGSYNYLGYAEVPDAATTAHIAPALRHMGVATVGAACGPGYSRALADLEHLVADFLHKERSIVSAMGFATNSQVLPAIVGPGCLLISDEQNHASIVIGARSTGAKIRVFKHNDAEDLEATLREEIVDGYEDDAGVRRPWRKILIVVEGTYSMEGVTARLREIVAVKKKYGAYLYLDEAHSIAALGATGRGAAEYWGVDLRDIDIMMGTFTKSFGAVGGYIAGSAELVERIRYTAAGALYGTAMAPVCISHAKYTLSQIMGRDGTDIGQRKILQLRENSIYFRQRLVDMGLQLYGDYDSPVIPIMLYNPAKIAAFSRECLARGLAVVVVGFPATPLILSRARICLSAAHTREDLDWALSVIEEVADRVQIRYANARTPNKAQFRRMWSSLTVRSDISSDDGISDDGVLDMKGDLVDDGELDEDILVE